MPKVKKCKICKKKFTPSIGVYGGGGHTKTCSAECSKVNWEQNHKYKPKRLIRCPKCGKNSLINL